MFTVFPELLTLPFPILVSQGCAVDEVREEKVESSRAMAASKPAGVKCDHLPRQRRRQPSGPHIFCELSNSLTDQQAPFFLFMNSAWHLVGTQ